MERRRAFRGRGCLEVVNCGGRTEVSKIPLSTGALEEEFVCFLFVVSVLVVDARILLLFARGFRVVLSLFVRVSLVLN